MKTKSNRADIDFHIDGIEYKKYGVGNCNNLRMVQYINVIFLRHGNYNCYLGVCKVSIQYVKSYDRERNDGSKGSWMIIRLCVNLLSYSPSPV